VSAAFLTANRIHFAEKCSRVLLTASVEVGALADSDQIQHAPLLESIRRVEGQDRFAVGPAPIDGNAHRAEFTCAAANGVFAGIR